MMTRQSLCSSLSTLGIMMLINMALSSAQKESETKPTLDDLHIFDRPTQNEDKQYWYDKGQEDLARSLKILMNTNVAKNVILFLGDGLGIPTIVAARIYKGQLNNVSGEEQELIFETFPYVALSKTYCVDRQVADSACTATAYLSGAKTTYETIGADMRVDKENCSSLNDETKVSSIAKWALDAGKRAGIVTSTRVTHATPAAAYAHSLHRDYECDEKLPEEIKEQCPEFKDIARQLIEDDPGKRLNVIMGGGYQYLTANATNRTGDVVNEKSCQRQDDKDLFQQWQEDKKAEAKKFAAVRSKSELMSKEVDDTDYLLGIFANNHLPYEYEKVKQDLDMPSLKEMTERAIQVLKRGDDGFFLLVEGGRIDHAHHDGMARKSLEETVAFDDAVQAALQLVDTEETLILVTADHSHVMTINGYPLRGQDIIGLAEIADDKLPYTTLMYTNGMGGFNYTSTTGDRWNITDDDVTNIDYVQLSAVPLSSETHGGEDVSIYAIGPMAHLFHGVHEQSYICHVMGYAACIGANKDHCNDEGEQQTTCPPQESRAVTTHSSHLGAGRLAVVVLLHLLMYLILN